MKFIELHLNGDKMIAVNVVHILSFIKQKDDTTYINFTDGSSKTVEEDYETVKELIGFTTNESIYNESDEFYC